MGRKAIFNWPAQDTSAVAQAQTLGAAGNLIINGNLNSNGIVVFTGIQRTVSLTSLGNLSGTNFTINGFLQGKSVTQTIAGPNVNTVYTTQLFDTVTSISANGAVGTAVNAGSGSTGNTAWLKYDSWANVYGFGVAVVVTNNITYSLQITLDDIHTVATPYAYIPSDWSGLTANNFGGVVVEQQPYTGAGAPTYSAPVFVPVPFDYISVRVTASNTTGALTATMLQQGVGK